MIKNDSERDKELQKGLKGEEGASVSEDAARDTIQVQSEVKSDAASEEKDSREEQHEMEGVGETASTHSSGPVQIERQDSPGIEAIQQVLVFVYELRSPSLAGGIYFVAGYIHVHTCINACMLYVYMYNVHVCSGELITITKCCLLWVRSW